MDLALSISIGLIAGVLSGMFGIGGSIITTPFMRIVLGVEGHIAVGTPLPIVIPTAISGVIAYHKKGMIRTREGLVCGAAGSFTGVIGAWLTQFFSGSAMMIITAIFIMLMAGRFALESRNGSGADQKDKNKKDGSRRVKTIWPRVVLTGIMAGFVSGFLGIGGGAILVPALVIVCGFGMHEAVATSLLAISIMAIPGSIEHYLIGNIDVSLLIPIAISAIIGAQIGARFSARTQEKRLRAAFTIFLVAIALYLGISELLGSWNF